MRHRRTLLIMIAAAALLSWVAAPTSSAKLLEQEHYSFSVSHIEQEEHGDEFCPNVGFPVLFEGEVSGMLLVKTKGSGPFPYFADRFHLHDVYTNLENGKTFTLDTVSRFSDQSIVDNGDGTITITVKDTARVHVYGPDGKRLFIDVGQIRFELLIDYNGTPDNPDDDIILEEFDPIKVTGHAQTEGRDFCEDLEFFLG
ncbi:MAG: hypothetical protein ACRDO2_15155 [Nocardioidaceae bacterium]